MMADLGVDAVGEVDDRRALRKIEHVALGGEDEDLFGEEVILDGGEELLRILDVLLPLDQAAQPGEALGLAQTRRSAFLVAPVRGDAFFGHPMHLGVRICTSIRCPRGPITVVCSDWYMLTLGSAM